MLNNVKRNVKRMSADAATARNMAIYARVRIPPAALSPESSIIKGSGDFSFIYAALRDFLEGKTRNNFRLPERFFVTYVKRNVKRNQHKKEAMPFAADSAALSSCMDSI